MKLLSEQVFEDIIRNPKNQREIPHLFGGYWYKDEIAVLFADTNVGKSIMAMDIAISICNGINHFNKEMSDETLQPVLYCDFELSDQQMARRYKNFPEILSNIKRVTFNTTNYGERKQETFLEELEDILRQPRSPKVVIIDNLSCIFNGESTAQKVVLFMLGIKRLTREYHLSVLLVGHCVKRNRKKEIDQNDLVGSKQIMNLCDSAFALGTSCRDSSLRYLKLVKSRNSPNSNTVDILQVEAETYLHMELVGEGFEVEHLGKKGRELLIGPETAKRILQLRRDGLSVRAISSETGISKSSVDRFLKGQTSEQDNV